MLKKGYWRSSAEQWPQALREPSYLDGDIRVKTNASTTLVAANRTMEKPVKRKSIAAPAAMVLSSAMLAACAVGPNYHQPEVA
ncbi:MAG: hypothetical protein ACJ8OJ_09495, partial [Povalibacter sp.]